MTATAATNLKPATDLLGIYQLADHLDTTLAMGEDLLAEKIEVAPLAEGDANEAIAARQETLSAFARRLRTLELGMVARLLQARARAFEVRDVHPRFQPFISLLIGGTASLAEAAADRGHGLGDVSELALASGPDVTVFLGSRGVLAADIQSLGSVTALAVTEDYLLLETIHLGTLLDMVGQFLDSLDLVFDLYAEPRAA